MNNMTTLNNTNQKENTVTLIHRIRISSQIIYCFTICLVLIAIALLPFLHVTMSVKSQGTLRSNLEKTEIFAPITGRIKSVSAEDNKRTTKGAILLTFDKISLQQQENTLLKRKKDLMLWLRDAQRASEIRALDLDKPNLSSALYLANWRQFREERKSALFKYFSQTKIFL